MLVWRCHPRARVVRARTRSIPFRATRSMGQRYFGQVPVSGSWVGGFPRPAEWARLTAGSHVVDPADDDHAEDRDGAIGEGNGHRRLGADPYSVSAATMPASTNRCQRASAGSRSGGGHERDEDGRRDPQLGIGKVERLDDEEHAEPLRQPDSRQRTDDGHGARGQGGNRPSGQVGTPPPVPAGSARCAARRTGGRPGAARGWRRGGPRPRR